MASSHKKGSATLEFTPPTGSGLSSPFLLAVPLSPLPDFEMDDGRERHAWRSADRSTREVVVIETDKADLFAPIRFDDQPHDLRTLLRLAEDGEITDLQYRPASSEGAVDVEVEAVMGQVHPDGARGGHGEFRADVHWLLDRSDLEALL